jgi:crotonobetainyl-CoA:carnitine CoA-transferase CaiB-like acyl-CoA transferase
MADVSGGLGAAVAVLAALHRRHTTGEGVHLEISLTDVARTLFAELGPVADARGDAVLTGGLALYNTYATSDGEHLAVAALEPKFAERACAVLGLTFDGDWLRPGPHQAARKAVVADKVRSLSLAQWEGRLQGIDACIDPVCRPRVGDDGVSGDLPPAPAHGEHGVAVLTEAGFQTEEIETLRLCGVVRIPN